MGLKLGSSGRDIQGEARGLNRTSVGLKLLGNSHTQDPRRRPQSNQRGIETVAVLDTGIAKGHEPQSNQRGIETEQTLVRALREANGLNRTSVGLKLSRGRPGAVAGHTPQSNQRGIETRRSRAARPRAVTSLNRTSVGLKPRGSWWRPWPTPTASIEPAWD